MEMVKANRSGKGYDFKITNISLPFSASVVGFNQGINLGGPTSLIGDDSYGVRHLQYAITKNTTEGNPSAPCLELSHPGMWRFRWVIKPGTRRISIRTKQIRSVSNQRPSLTIKANSVVGLNSDLVVYAPSGTDWVDIGPVVFTATGTDMVWVEIRNNLQLFNSPAYFDHIVAT